MVSPPFVFLPLVKSLLKPDFHVAAQNCWVKKGGAFTGEIRYEIYCQKSPFILVYFSDLFNLCACLMDLH